MSDPIKVEQITEIAPSQVTSVFLGVVVVRCVVVIVVRRDGAVIVVVQVVRVDVGVDTRRIHGSISQMAICDPIPNCF